MNLNEKEMTQKHYLYIKLGLITVFLVTRMINLDADVPFGWKLARYQHFDEIFYSMPALHLFHYGTWDVEKLGFKFIEAGITIAIPVWNLLTFIFLETFQNALIAVRFPAVLAGLGIYFLYLSLLSRLNNLFEKYGNFSSVLHILFAVYPLVDPIFYLSNTTNEATIYRLLFASWLFYIFVNSDTISKKKAFWIGVLAAFSVFFVYLYNLFLPLFAFLVLLQKPHRNTLLSFFCGIVVIVIIWLAAFEWLYNVSFPDTLAAIVGGVRGVQSLRAIDVLMRIALLFITNFLAFSPALLVFFSFGAMGLPLLISFNQCPMLIVDEKLRSKVNHVLALSWLFLISYILQSVFISDFIQRKGLIIYFPVLILSYIFLATISSISVFKLRGRLLFSAAMFIIGAGLLIYAFFLATFLVNAGYYSLDRWVGVTRTSYFGVCSIFIFSVIALLVIPKMGIRKWVGPLILAITIIFNTQLLVIHKFLNSPRSFYETISGIGNLPSGYFLGNLSYSFTIGNSQHKPFLYLYTVKAMKVPNWYLSVNELNVSVFNKFIENVQVPVYTVVETRQGKDMILRYYPKAKVVYSNLKYRGVQTYLDYRGLNGSEANKYDEIYVLQLNES